MESRKKALLIRQISALGEAMKQQSDVEAAISAADLCSALLQTTNDAIPSMNADELEDLQARFSGINQQLSTFFQLAHGKTEIDKELADAVQRRKTLQQDDGALRKKLNHEQAEIARLEKQLQSDTAALRQLQARLQKAEAKHKEILAEIRKCSPEQTALLEQENERQQAQILHAEAGKKELEATRDELSARLQELTKEIDAIPAETRELERQYTEQDAQLKRLRSIADLYSPEKQAELEKQLEALKTSAKENQDAIHSLNSRLETLNIQVSSSNDERQELSSELLDKLEDSMSGLQRDLSDHEDRLAGIRRNADTLRQRLSACLTERRQLHDWLDTDVTPLEVMARALERTEAAELRKTLDPGALSRVQTLRTEIRQRLEDLDQILDICSKAVGLDQTMVDRMSGRMG